MKSKSIISLLSATLLTLTLTACNPKSIGTLTQAEAETIALEHAGFTAEEVNGLHTEYEVDNGIPLYDVKFHQNYLEYDYDIHAETDAILSFDKDD